MEKMTEKPGSPSSERFLFRLYLAALIFGATVVAGFNALLFRGVFTALDSAESRIATVQRLLGGGVSADGVAAWLAANPPAGGAPVLFIMASAVASVGTVALMVLLVRSLRREARLVRESQRYRQSRNLCAHMRDLAMECSPMPLAVLDARGKPVLRNRSFEELAPGLVSALVEKLATPPVSAPAGATGPNAPGDGAAGGAGEPAEQQEDSTLIWTSPHGEGHRVRIQRWFLTPGHTLSLIALDDPWKPSGFATPLDLARMGAASRLEANIDANESLTRALESLAPRIKAVSADIRAHVLPMVRAIEDDLEALFRTVVETALYSEGTRRFLRVDIGARIADGIATISIEDNGNGTQTWDLPEILYGRTLTINARPGEGTRVSFDVPVARAEGPGLSISPAGPEAG